LKQTHVEYCAAHVTDINNARILVLIEALGGNSDASSLACGESLARHQRRADRLPQVCRNFE
jgi:hypothetical protein